MMGNVHCLSVNAFFLFVSYVYIRVEFMILLSEVGALRGSVSMAMHACLFYNCGFFTPFYKFNNSKEVTGNEGRERRCRSLNLHVTMVTSPW